jgi:ATP-binding cassette subfamily B protein
MSERSFVGRHVARAAGLAGELAYAARLLWRHARLPGLLLLAHGLLSGAAQPLVVWAVQGLIDALGAGHPDPWPGVLPWLALLFGARLVLGVDLAAGSYLAEVTRERMQTGMQRQLFEHTLEVPLATLEQPEYWQLLETGREAVHGDLAYSLKSLAQLLSSLVSAAGLLFLFVQAHWLLGAVLGLTAVVNSWRAASSSRAYSHVNLRTSPLRREMAYWSGLLTGRRAAAEVRLFDLGPTLLDRWRAVFERYLADVTAARRRLARHSVASSALQTAVVWATTTSLLLMAAGGRLSAGALVALLYGLDRLHGALTNVGNAMRDVVHYETQLAHLRRFLAVEPEPQPAPGVPALARPLRQGVRFHEVGFTYPGSERPALQGVELTLRPGEHLALVGENGAGKTTLVRLLLGLYLPTEGAITVDGVDLALLDPRQWRREATAVFQDFMRYPTTVGENIAYAEPSLLAIGAGGLPELEPIHPRVAGAAARSGAHDFVQRLPRGYATLLARGLDRKSTRLNSSHNR